MLHSKTAASALSVFSMHLSSTKIPQAFLEKDGWLQHSALLEERPICPPFPTKSKINWGNVEVSGGAKGYNGIF